jgi:hypothetical protein
MAGTGELCTMKNRASDFVKTRQRWSMLAREPIGRNSRVIDILFILKAVDKSDDVGMIQRPVDLNWER